MKKIFIFIAIAHCLMGYSKNYYVSNSGSNNNLGTIASPLKTIQKGADLAGPGDTVFVRQGEYVASTYYTPILLYTKSGGTATARLTIKNYPGETPTLRPIGGTDPASSGTWALIKIQASETTPTVVPAYIDIEGLVLHGRSMEINPVSENTYLENQPGRYNVDCPDTDGDGIPNGCEWVRYNGQGMVVTGPFAWSDELKKLPQYAIPHHIKVKNCVFKEFPGAGLSLQRFDFCDVINCEFANNCWYTIFGSSGLNLYMATDYIAGYTHSTTDYSIQLIGNKVYGNTLKVIAQNLVVRYDGNGIIVDNFNHSQDYSSTNSAKINNKKNRGDFDYPAYDGKTLIANNVVFGNGGSGIKSYTTDNVDIFHNTLYNNAIGGYGNAGLYVQDGNGHRVINNISYNDVSETNPIAINSYDVNENNYSLDPKFLDPKNDRPSIVVTGLVPDITNYLKLDNSSPAVDAASTWIDGIGRHYPYINYDFLNRERKWDISFQFPDIGAFEILKCRDQLRLGGLAYSHNPPSEFTENIKKGQRVMARAQKAIVIEPDPEGSDDPAATNGFQVDYGAIFTAEIEPCNQLSGRLGLYTPEETSSETFASNEENNEAMAYPNPVSDGFLHLNKTVANFILVNASGKNVLTGANTSLITVDGLQKGLYLLKIDGQIQKIIIE